MSEALAMRGLAGMLQAGGLAVTECVSADGLVELAVTNPADPGGGWVYVGYEGYLIWERWAPGDVGSDREAVIAAVTGMLSGSPGDGEAGSGRDTTARSE
jgi:hypothetical protein